MHRHGLANPSALQSSYREIASHKRKDEGCVRSRCACCASGSAKQAPGAAQAASPSAHAPTAPGQLSARPATGYRTGYRPRVRGASAVPRGALALPPTRSKAFDLGDRDANEPADPRDLDFTARDRALDGTGRHAPSRSENHRARYGYLAASAWRNTALHCMTLRWRGRGGPGSWPSARAGRRPRARPARARPGASRRCADRGAATCPTRRHPW